MDAESALTLEVLDLLALEPTQVASLGRLEAICGEAIRYCEVLEFMVHLGRAETLSHLLLPNSRFPDLGLVARSHPVEVVCAVGASRAIITVT
jgi:hypothetical protein